MPDPIERINNVRKYRGRREWDSSLAGSFARAEDEARRVQKKLGALIDQWEAIVPEHIANQTKLTGIRGGVLHVRVGSAPIAYELDRLLREGAEQALRETFPGTLRSIRRTIGPVTGSAAAGER